MEELLKALLTVQLEDLFVLLMYFMVAASKSTDVITSSPAGRGLEWLRERVRPIDLSWLGTDRSEDLKELKMGSWLIQVGLLRKNFQI